MSTRISYSAEPAKQYLGVAHELETELRFSRCYGYQEHLLLGGVMEMAAGELRWRCRGLLPSRWSVLFMVTERGSQQGERREKMATGNHCVLCQYLLSRYSIVISDAQFCEVQVDNDREITR